MLLRNNQLAALLQVLATLQVATSTPTPSKPAGFGQYPTREIAGVAVVDTPIIRDAHDLAKQYSVSYLYKHVMRSWLFGALILSHNETLSTLIDPEVHAISALLHDLGVAEGSDFVSQDKRFEVDGAEAARGFVQQFARTHDHEGDLYGNWDAQKQQLIWDSIALHSQKSIAIYKEPVVATVCNGIQMDFFGPDFGVTQKEYDAVLAEYPIDDFLSGFNQTLLWLAETKPNSTYDTWQQPWGDYLVEGYSAVGKRAFDVIAGIHSELIESK